MMTPQAGPCGRPSRAFDGFRMFFSSSPAMGVYTTRDSKGMKNRKPHNPFDKPAGLSDNSGVQHFSVKAGHVEANR